MKPEKLTSTIIQYYQKIKSLINRVKVRIKKFLHKVNEYIKEDYGIDLSRTKFIFKFIRENILFRIIFDFLILILSILVAIGWAGSVLVLTLTHPVFMVLYLSISILSLTIILEYDNFKYWFKSSVDFIPKNIRRNKWLT